MSLEGLRAWIAEVERKLAKRTRVFLVLTVIAIGVGAAGVYLAIDARDNSVSKDDVRELQQQLEARIDEAVITPVPAPSAAEEGESGALEAPAPEAKSGKQGGSASGKSPSDGGSGGESSGGAGTPNSATGGAAAAAELQELAEAAKQRQAEREREGE